MIVIGSGPHDAQCEALRVHEGADAVLVVVCGARSAPTEVLFSFSGGAAVPLHMIAGALRDLATQLERLPPRSDGTPR